MQSFHFREEERPKFNIRSAGLSATLMMLLLLIFVARAQPFDMSEEELEVLAAQQEARQRDMVFRFMDTPDNVEENPDAKYVSDANRIKQSAPQLTEKPENDDPVSVGNSLELKQEPLPTVPSEPQQAQPQSQPSPQPKQAEPQPQEQQDEPDKPSEEPTPKEPEPVQPTIDDPMAPKPYRRLTQKERQDAQREASIAMKAQDARPRGATTERFDNPNGRSAPQAGFSIDTAGHDLGPYLKILQQLVKSNWRIPAIARFEVRGFSIIDFKLHSDGRITDARIYTQSGYEPLDTASLNAITGIYKAPPLPEHIKEPWIPIKFGFYYNMRPHR